MATKTIDATDLRNNLGEAIDIAASGETLLVKKRGKLRVAMIDLDRYEDLLAASDPEYRKDIANARAQHQKGEVFTLEEVFGDL